jgi:hypothetical protein
MIHVAQFFEAINSNPSLGRLKVESKEWIQRYRTLVNKDVNQFKTVNQLEKYIDELRQYHALLHYVPEKQLRRYGVMFNTEHMQEVTEGQLRKSSKKLKALWEKENLTPGHIPLFALNGLAGGKFSDTKIVDRKQIITEPKTFQGREAKFAKETVDKIVREGFDKSQDPIIVWYDEKAKKYIVISGHSRFEASQILFDRGDSSLAKMPVKVFLGSKEQAQEYALLESNRSGTAESLSSDIKAYVLAKEKGYNRDRLLSLFKPESKLRLVQDLSFLNSKGRFMEYLDTDSEKQFPYLRRNAQWVGTMRRSLPQLTDSHEKELFDYLYSDTKALGIKKDQFFDLVDKKVSKIDYDPTKPLNLKNVVSTSAVTSTGDLQLKDLANEINKLKKVIDQKNETIVRARREGKDSFVPQLQSDISNLQQTIQKKLEEIDRVKRDLKKIEETTTFDLFSQPAPAVEEPKKVEKKDNQADNSLLQIAKAKAAALILLQQQKIENGN